MTDETQFKHAKLTGQTMRDHWGPIVDRIANEITDPYAAAREQTERETVEKIVAWLRGSVDPFTSAFIADQIEAGAWK